jgi:hypothetical protein
MLSKDSLSNFVRSRLFAGIIIGVGVIIVLLCIFEAGIAVGYHEAVFSSHWGANYERNFGDDSMMGSMGLPDGHDPDPHGAIGQILSMSSSTLVIENDQKQEQKILIDKDTTVRNLENTISASALTVGNFVVVVGDPNDQGTIDAKLIRIIPAPPSSSVPTASTTP